MPPYLLVNPYYRHKIFELFIYAIVELINLCKDNAVQYLLRRRQVNYIYVKVLEDQMLSCVELLLVQP